MLSPGQNSFGPPLDRLPAWHLSYRVARKYPFSPVNSVSGGAFSEARRTIFAETSAESFFRHPDLLQELFSYFAKDKHCSEERKQLLGFMLISKCSFHYPARVLWSSIGDRFDSALGCLLDLDKWECGLERNLSGNSLLVALERNRNRLAKNIMWKKFLYYADGIRWIEAATATVSPGTISLLTQLLPHSDPILFPSLRCLHWTETLATDSNDLMYMLSPSLDELQLHVYDFYDAAYTSFACSEWVARIVHASAHLCPSIRFFSIEGTIQLTQNISSITYFGSLHQLIITQQAFDSSEEVVAPPTLFRGLEDLELVSNHGSKSLLKSLPFIVPLLADTLRTVYIQSVAGTSTLDTHGFIDNFRPLLNLKRLAEVRLNFMLLGFQFTDRDLVAVAKAWPSIIEMGFAFRSLSWSPVPRLETIGTVATHCRLLRRITVPIISGPNGMSPFKISAPPSHPLEEIRTHTMTWNIQESDKITFCLKQAFPNLRGAFGTPDSEDLPAEELLWAVLPPYILSSKIGVHTATRVPHRKFV